jgi:hypothetical protein
MTTKIRESTHSACFFFKDFFPEFTIIHSQATFRFPDFAITKAQKTSVSSKKSKTKGFVSRSRLFPQFFCQLSCFFKVITLILQP